MLKSVASEAVGRSGDGIAGSENSIAARFLLPAGVFTWYHLGGIVSCVQWGLHPLKCNQGPLEIVNKEHPPESYSP